MPRVRFVTVRVGRTDFQVSRELTLTEAALLYLGFDRLPYEESAETLGVSPEEAQKIVWRKDAELGQITARLRALVQTAELLTPVRHNAPHGVPDENRTTIYLSSFIEVARNFGAPAEPLKTLVDEWCKARGLPGTTVRPGRPTARPLIWKGLETLAQEGRLSGNARNDRLLVLAMYQLGGEPVGWNPKTFGRVRKDFLHSQPATPSVKSV